MVYYTRDLEKIVTTFQKFPVIALLGPRQSGKSTLAKHFFKNHTFLNLEDLELRTQNFLMTGSLRSWVTAGNIIADIKNQGSHGNR